MLDTVIVFSIVILILWYWKSYRHPSSFPHGPRFPLPMLGDAYILGKDIEKGIKNLTLKYGKICGFWMGAHRAVVVADFEILQELLNKPETVDRQQLLPEIAGLLRNGMSHQSIPGVVLSIGQTWTEMRRTSLHTLKNFGYGKSILEDTVEEEIDNLLEHIDNHFLNQPIDVIRFLQTSVLAALWRILSGEQLKMGDAKLEEIFEMVEVLMTDLGNPLAVISVNHPRLFKLVNHLGILQTIPYNRSMINFTGSVLTDHKKRHIDGENPLTLTEAFLYKIQQTTDKSSPFYGDVGELNLVNVLYDLFVAGSDTTAATLNWAMLFMIQNPDVQTKVRQELNQNIGGKKVKMSDKNKIPYTEAVIHEIQRRGNIAPLAIFHQTTTNVDIGPYSVPPETAIIPFIGDIMNDPEHFPDPTKFKPERYLVNDGDSQDVKFQAHPRVIPFGLGKRRCLGEVLAKMTLYKFFTALIQKYEIVSGQSEPIIDTRVPGLVMAPTKYKLMFKPQNMYTTP